MKILCGIDGKGHSLKAADVAGDLAKRLGAELILCMVNPLLPGRGPPVYLWPAEHIARVLEDAVRKAKWCGVPSVRSETWWALHVSDAIASYADEKEIDYIVIGASGRSLISSVLNGSVSRELPLKANCPVMVVHKVRGERPTGRQRGRRIDTLVAEVEPPDFGNARSLSQISNKRP